jgi:beta-lactamase class A
MTRLSRRQALFGGLTLAIMAASAPKTALADPAEPLAPINERLDALERRHNAIVGVHAVDIETGRNVGHRDAELFACVRRSRRTRRPRSYRSRSGAN